MEATHTLQLTPVHRTNSMFQAPSQPSLKVTLPLSTVDTATTIKSSMITEFVNTSPVSTVAVPTEPVSTELLEVESVQSRVGHKLPFIMVATNSVITYKVNGSIRKEWKFAFWVHENIMYQEIDKFYKEELLKATSKSDISSATWKVVEERAFTKEEINAVNQAVVVTSQYGNSIQFTMNENDKPCYIPLDKSCDIKTGEVIDIAKAKLLTLEKKGESKIYRVWYQG